MRLKIYQIDAFASKVFEGNPAMVCPLEKWIDDELMQKIAEENNLSETAFFVKEKYGYGLRWFTPKAEVDMCGHATLASAYVIFEYLDYNSREITFFTKSGKLKVNKDKNYFIMDFPIQPIELCDISNEVENIFSIKPKAIFKSIDYIIVFNNEKMIRDINPNFELLKGLNLRGVCITAKSRNYDFVTRFFAPKIGVNEDPVTGSIFTQLVSYWSKELNKKELFAKQLSSRGGEVLCKVVNNRVKIRGKVIKYLEGWIEIR